MRQTFGLRAEIFKFIDTLDLCSFEILTKPWQGIAPYCLAAQIKSVNWPLVSFKYLQNT